MVMGFAVPLYIIFAANLVVAALLMLPRPLCKPAVWIIQFSRTQIGMSITGTTVAFLLMLLATPLYDLFKLHESKEAHAAQESAPGGAGESIATDHARGMTEATANLSAVLIVSNMVLALVNRKLGITIAELEGVEQRAAPPSSQIDPNEVLEKKAE